MHGLFIHLKCTGYFYHGGLLGTFKINGADSGAINAWPAQFKHRMHVDVHDLRRPGTVKSITVDGWQKDKSHKYTEETQEALGKVDYFGDLILCGLMST